MQHKQNYYLKPIYMTDVQIEDNFWKPRQEVLYKTTIPDLLDLAQDRIDNFAITGGLIDGKILAANSPDSDLYKILESMSYLTVKFPGEDFKEEIREIIASIAAAQQDDGYLNTQHTLPLEYAKNDPGAIGFGPELRWKSPKWPEGIGQLYCAGHLFEAAAARYRANGESDLLRVATRLADHIGAIFGQGKRNDYVDHPCVEQGLLALYEVTGKREYLELASFILLDMKHGRPNVDIEDDTMMPLPKQREAYGHCVRTMYLYCALTKLAIVLDDLSFFATLDSLWHSIVDHKMYITGAIGNGTHAEQHGYAYDLPNEMAYAECCASIGMAFWNHNLNLLTGDARYVDIMELAAYNSALSGISLGGREYFYCNKLAAPVDHTRRWRYLFCCPSNIPRFIAGLGNYIYAVAADSVYVNLYAGSSAKFIIMHRTIKLKVETNYPREGKIRLKLFMDAGLQFDIYLRIPGWCIGNPVPGNLYHYDSNVKIEPPILLINDKLQETQYARRGYLRLSRTWNHGDVIELELPMPVRRIYAHPAISQNKGRFALMKGPVVYCIEGIDNRGSVSRISVPADSRFTCEYRPDLLGGVDIIKGQALFDGNLLATMTAIPYYAWDNRDSSDMAVWIKEG